jgi:NAD(P)-dependent dehydrogenase (short-subunit alcohol dehydrogenase family)
MTGILSKFKLEGRTAVVTGGARGLGLSMASGLADAGANIVIPDIDYETAEKTSKDIAKKDVKTLALKVDVTDENDVLNMVSRTIDEFGQIDILVNNAGVGKQIPAEEMSKKDWEEVINVNLTGVFLCAREVGKKMIERRQGSIINIASMSGYIVNCPLPQTAQASYNTSKAGVIHLTKSLAAEWARYNIRVNAIAPGYMKTRLNADYLKQHPASEEFWVRLTPMGRMGLPEELQGAVVFLASDASSFMTGDTLIIDGGYTIL